ncbi:hypothetical protein LCGC14_0392880 [marine sediment metagenome]|uniref:Uncharacterized protein n=1 Tax=marine sediment metagenome TaxID=412755 RepID=A0A0F9TH23_9ZZZZ
MAKGVRATRKQAAAGRRNVLKAQVSRIGLRGTRPQPRKPRGV